MSAQYPTSRKASQVKTIDYFDPELMTLLLLKAVVLVPLWAVPIVPFIGFICRSMGPVANQIGLGLILVLGLNYFFDGLLKLKIRLDDTYLYFGFRTYRIDEIISVDLTYRKRSLIPKALVLTMQSGKSIKLNMQGISHNDAETLLKHLQACNSNLKTASVVPTLIKCTRVAPRPKVETKERLVVPYHSQQIVEDSLDAFRLSAIKWVRMGPMLLCAVLSPVWIISVSTLYACLHAASFEQLQRLNLNAFIGRTLLGMQDYFLSAVEESAKAAISANADPAAMYIAWALLAALIVYLYRISVKPNLLFADDRGIKLQLLFFGTTFSLAEVDWQDVRQAALHKPGGVETWAVRFKKVDGTNFDINLSFLTPEDRSRLLKRMEQKMTGCEIEPELSQSMLPKAERSYTELWLQSLNQAPERKTLDPLEPGKTIGEERFEVLRTLGIGGQGTAYLCRSLEEKTSETVVLKETILPVFVEDGVRRKAFERFEQEAKMLKSIKHDGVVKLIDYFIEDHRAYLVLEHIDGCTLRDLIARDGAMTEEKAHDLALQMCNLLRALHSHSIVHRDFTPDNLILDWKGKLRLIDFNVAQQIQEGSTGTIVGKHAYVPPEQFRGKATAQSDLYAFGATMHFLLTGADPEPISQSSPAARADVSCEMDNIVKRATALQTNKRYQDIDEIEKDLLAIDAQVLTDGTTLSVKLRQKEGVVEHG